MSAKKRRIKRKIKRIIRMDRQARGYWKGMSYKSLVVWANISAICRSNRMKGTYYKKAWDAIGNSRLDDKPIYRPKL